MPYDHYETLGVDEAADRAAIRAAYLRVMRAHHPDHRPGDPRSAERARAANIAWGVLSDPRRRADYDRARVARGTDPPHRTVSAAGVTVNVGDRTRRVEERALRQRAYSPEGQHYRVAFTRACWRIAVGVFLLAFVMMVGLS